jgi:hypothetical protein
VLYICPEVVCNVIDPGPGYQRCQPKESSPRNPAMKKCVSYFTTYSFLTVCLGITSLFLGGAAMATELKVGAKAPQFELPGSDGKTYSLADLNKKGKVVVIAWYPKAFTGG